MLLEANIIDHEKNYGISQPTQEMYRVDHVEYHREDGHRSEEANDPSRTQLEKPQLWIVLDASTEPYTSNFKC